MNSTWQRIIKAGKGILEIAREREETEYFAINEQLFVHYFGDSTAGSLDGYVSFYHQAYVATFSIPISGKPRFDIDVEALNHLEEIAQAFEEAREIWREM